MSYILTVSGSLLQFCLLPYLPLLVSYMYVGLAIRTALAMGINREPATNVKKSAYLRKAESRTWW